MAQDPSKVDPNHYTVDFENDDVRVLRIRYAAGEKSVMHGHRKSVVVFLTDAKGRFTYPDGKTEDLLVKGGQVMYTGPTEHLPENTGEQPFEVLQIELLERPLLSGWSVRGVERLSEGSVRGKIKLVPLRPYDPAAIARARAAIDSLYEAKGFYRSSVSVRQVDQPDGSVRAMFDVDEGRRVAISQVNVQGNEHFKDGAIAGHMKTGPEGFFWWQTGAYQEEQLAEDISDRLPAFYGQQGYPDFRVLSASLDAAPATFTSPSRCRKSIRKCTAHWLRPAGPSSSASASTACTACGVGEHRWEGICGEPPMISSPTMIACR